MVLFYKKSNATINTTKYLSIVHEKNNNMKLQNKPQKQVYITIIVIRRNLNTTNTILIQTGILSTIIYTCVGNFNRYLQKKTYPILILLIHVACWLYLK